MIYPVVRIMALYKLAAHIPSAVKAPLDLTALVAPIAAWLGVLSVALTIIATLFTIVWIGIRILESDTVQKWIKGRKLPGNFD